MRNLNVYNGNTAEFLDEVIASKRNSPQDPNYIQRINRLAPTVKLLFENYEIAHNANNHVSLVSNGYVNQDKTDLLKLYNSGNARLIKLKNSVTTILDNRAMNTCQYCTIAPVGSLDHIVPKGEFPEFSVNPQNLLPSCTICNSHKNENWKENNKTIFLNLYTDILPTEQYLFVDLIINKGDIQPKFELRNTNNINADFFALLESHYFRLHLPQRFNKESHKIISELTNLISASRKILNKDEIIKIVKTKIIEDRIIFGNNYFKSILEKSLIDNQDYVDGIFC